jgi:hypothetical protein
MKRYTAELDKRLAEIEREQKFWNTLTDIGFKVDPFAVSDMSGLRHEVLPLSTSFYIDKIEMKILRMTIETGCWIYPKEESYVMTCEQFIQYQIFRVRRMTNSILTKLDNRTL